MKNELVKLGIPPSQASEAVNVLWEHWDKNDISKEQNLYAIVWPSNDKWIVDLFSQKKSGGPLLKVGKSSESKSIEELKLPKQVFAVIPISDILDRVSSKLAELLKR